MNGIQEYRKSESARNVNPPIGIEKQKCSGCKEIKNVSDFHKDRSRERPATYCKICSYKRHRQWVENNKGRLREYFKRWYEANREAQREKGRQYRFKNRSILTEKSKQWTERNPEKVKETRRKLRSTPKGKLRLNISSRMSRTLSHNIKRNGCRRVKVGYKWERIVGYTLKELMDYMEKRFKPSMTWDNYGEWHIDHIIPTTAFNFETVNDIDFKRCWKLSNLQPMWAKDNQSKSDNIKMPFQPSLALTA